MNSREFAAVWSVQHVRFPLVQSLLQAHPFPFLKRVVDVENTLCGTCIKLRGSIVFNKKIVAKGIAKIDSPAVGESSVLIHKDDLIIL